VDTPRPSPRTNRTRSVPHPVRARSAATGSGAECACAQCRRAAPRTAPSRLPAPPSPTARRSRPAYLRWSPACSVAPSAAFARRTSAAVSSSCARAACAARRVPRSGGCATARATARATTREPCGQPTAAEESARLLGALVCGAPADVGEFRAAAADQINAPFNPPKDVESRRAPSRALRLGRQREEREAV